MPSYANSCSPKRDNAWQSRIKRLPLTFIEAELTLRLSFPPLTRSLQLAKYERSLSIAKAFNARVRSGFARTGVESRTYRTLRAVPEYQGAVAPGTPTLYGYRKKRCLPVSRLRRKHFVSVQSQSVEICVSYGYTKDGLRTYRTSFAISYVCSRLQEVPASFFDFDDQIHILFIRKYA